MSPPRPVRDVEALRADLLAHARDVIARDGVDGLTMRALARQAGTAVGLSYKAFTSRDELLWELTWRSLVDLARRLDDWAARTGGELGERLMEFTDIAFASVAPTLVGHLAQRSRGAELFREAVNAGITRSWATVMAEFLEARQRDGDVRADVDVEAFAYILTAAIHHVLVTEGPFQTPDRSTLARYLTSIAAQITGPRVTADETRARRELPAGDA